MKVTATKIVEEPHTEISTQSVVTGKRPSRNDKASVIAR